MNTTDNPANWSKNRRIKERKLARMAAAFEARRAVEEARKAADTRNWEELAARIDAALRDQDPEAVLPYAFHVESVYHANDGDDCAETITIQFYRTFSAADENERDRALEIAAAIMGYPAESWGDGAHGWSREPNA